MDAPRVDFYLLEDPEGAACDVTACRIAEKAWRQGHRVHLHADSPESARRLDDLLWTWRDESFVPHSVWSADAAADEPGGGAPVTIGWGTLPGFAAGVLLNLGSCVPEGFERFARIAELVGGAESSRTAGRERFRRYRAQGCDLRTHRL